MTLAHKSSNLLSQQKIENTINLIRKISICIIVVVLAAIIFGQGFTQSEAAVIKEGSGSSAVFKVGGAEYKVADLRNKVFGGAVLDLACAAYGGLTAFDTEVLQINTTASYWSSIDAVYGAISSVGAGLALLWCMLELIEKSSQGHITGEFILQLGIKFTIAAVVIAEGGEIAKGVINLANGVTGDMLGGFNSAAAGSTLDARFVEVYNDIKNAKVFACVGAMIPLLLPAIIMKLCTIIMFALLAGRILEVAVRYIFFPIGASDVFTHGMGSPGFRYIKKLFGAALQGIAMYAVVYVGMLLMNNADDVIGSAASTTVGGVVIDAVFPIIVAVSIIGAMLKVSSIVNDIAG
jgi:hypothetical protein